MFAALLSNHSFGACEVASTLIREYGITFAGFEKPLPRASGPDLEDKSVVQIWSQASPRTVKDGFTHSIFFNENLKKAWVYRSGGFGGVHEWYGPVDVSLTDMDECRQRTEPRPLTNRSKNDAPQLALADGAVALAGRDRRS